MSNTIQHSWAPLLSKAQSHSPLPRRSFKRPKSALLKSSTVRSLSTLLVSLRVLDSMVSCLLQPSLPLGFPVPTRPSLLVRIRSSLVPLILGSLITQRRKLPLVHYRTLLDCLCSAVSSLQQVLGWLNSIMRDQGF